jgi:hypothetical protein
MEVKTCLPSSFFTSLEFYCWKSSLAAVVHSKKSDLKWSSVDMSMMVPFRTLTWASKGVT